jgi:ethanolamine transporter
MTFAELRDYLLDGRTFVESCRYIKDHSDAPLVIACAAAIFTVVSGFDYINGNKFGYGEQYSEAWKALPPLALSMIGITCLTPIFRIVLTPIFAPVFRALLSHPAMLAGVLLAPDMGGYPLAVRLADGDLSQSMFSVILGSMLGATIVFTIPVGLSIIDQTNTIFFAYGTLLGILAIPFGCIVGGFAMAVTTFSISTINIFKDLIPIFVIMVLLALALYFFPFATLRGFMHFSQAISFLMTFGALLAIFQEQTHLRLPLWSTMVDDAGENSLQTVLLTVSQIAMMLTGIIPLVHFVITLVGPYLARLVRKIGLTRVDASGIVASLASVLPMLGMFDKMTHKGMIFNAAFEVGAAFSLGDHLAYMGSVRPDMIVPMLVGKITAGIVSIGLSVFAADFLAGKGEELLKERADGERVEEDAGLKSEPLALSSAYTEPVRFESADESPRSSKNV